MTATMPLAINTTTKNPLQNLGTRILIGGKHIKQQDLTKALHTKIGKRCHSEHGLLFQLLTHINELAPTEYEVRVEYDAQEKNNEVIHPRIHLCTPMTNVYITQDGDYDQFILWFDSHVARYQPLPYSVPVSAQYYEQMADAIWQITRSINEQQEGI